MSGIPASRRVTRAAIRFTRHAKAGVGASAVSSHVGGAISAKTSQTQRPWRRSSGGRRTVRLRQQRTGDEADHLPPRGALTRADRPLSYSSRQARAADLAARRLQHGVGRREHDLVGRDAEHRHGGVDVRSRRVALGRGGDARLGQDHQALGAQARVGTPNTATQPRRARDRADRLLDLVRIDVAPARMMMSLTRPVR